MEGKLLTDWPKELIQENTVLFFTTSIFGKPPQIIITIKIHLRILFIQNTNSIPLRRKKNVFLSLRRSCKGSLERQHKIKVVCSRGHRKSFWRAAVLNLIRTVILQTLMLTQSSPFRRNSVSIEGHFRVLLKSQQRKEGRTYITQLTHLVSHPREQNLTRYFTLPPAAFCYIPSLSLPGALLLSCPPPFPAESKTDSDQESSIILCSGNC